MPTITLGTILLTFAQFTIIMTLIFTALSQTSANAGIVPANFIASYYGSNGLVNTTINNFTGSLVSPLTTQANSSKTGFAAINPGSLLSFGGLAFIPGFIGAMYKIFIQTPQLILLMIFSALSYPVSLGYISIVAMGTISLILVSYLMAIVVLKFVNIVAKVVSEEI